MLPSSHKRPRRQSFAQSLAVYGSRALYQARRWWSENRRRVGLLALPGILLPAIFGVLLGTLGNKTAPALVAGTCTPPSYGDAGQYASLQPALQFLSNIYCNIWGSHDFGPPAAALGTEGPVANEHYLWKAVAIGGGGYITGSSWDRHRQTYIIRTDVHGGYRWDRKRDQWLPLATAASMPESYRTQAGIEGGAYEVAVAPGDSHRAYMAIKDRVFRSDDGGENWIDPGAQAPFPVSLNANGPYRFYGPMLAVDPSNADVVLFGIPKLGLWASRDAGQSWTQIASVPPSPMIGDNRTNYPGIPIWFEPDAKPGQPRRVLAAVAGSGLFVADARTLDFKPVGGPPFIRQASFSRDGSLLVADSISQSVAIWRGGRWLTNISGGLPKGRFASIAADPRANRYYAISEGGDAWCSDDLGRNWRAVLRRARAGQGEPPWLRITDRSYFSVASLAFDPVQPSRLWFNTGVGVFLADLTQGCSDLHLVSQSRGIEEMVANDVIQPIGGAPLFAAWDFGIHLKHQLDRFSSTYGPRERMLIAAQALDWSPSNPAFIVTNATDTRMECCSEDGDSVLAGFSLDGGMTWQKFAHLPQPPGTRADDPWRMSFGTIAVAANDTNNIIWAPAFNRSPFYTKDRGRSWHRVALPGEVLPLTGSFSELYLARKSLIADRVLPNSFYLMHSGTDRNAALTGLWRTTDGGASWSRRFMGEIAPNSQFAAKLRAVPGKAEHLFFTSAVHDGDATLRRSTDGGATWDKVPGIDRADDIAFGKAAKGSTYPTIFVSALHEGRYGIWRSIDDAMTWHMVAAFPLGRLDRVKVMEGDKDVFGRIYIGFMGSGWLYGEPAPCTPRPPLDPIADCAIVQ